MREETPQAEASGAPGDAGTILVVLPAYDEQARIGILLERIDVALHEAGLDYHIVVVDDGSRDATAKIVKDVALRLPITLVQHPRNLGLGATLRDGLGAAVDRAHGRDIVVTMDADDTHSPGLILRMVRLIGAGCDVVIASRYRSGSRSVGVPLGRRFLSYGGSWLLRLLFPIPGVRDYTCGYRAYRADVLARAIRAYGDGFVDQDGFQSTLDILLKLRTLPLRFGEVPFQLRYDVKEGTTKMDVPRTVRNTLALVVKRRLGR